MPGDKLKRVKSVKKWLDKAENSYLNNKDISGELNLMMAQAEMQRLKGQMVAKLNGSCMAMGEYGGTQYTISYNPVSRTGITKDNLQKMKLLHPDIYDEYVTVSESRRFCIKAKAADEAA